MRSEHKGQKIFAVSVLIGSFTGTPWPFGSLDVSDEQITVRTFFNERTCPKSELTEISLERLGPQCQLLFRDFAGEMADVSVVLAMRVERVVGELRRRGYLVVDRRTSTFQFLFPVHWGDQDSAEDSYREP